MSTFRNGNTQTAFRNGNRQVAFRNGEKVLGAGFTHLITVGVSNFDSGFSVNFGIGDLQPRAFETYEISGLVSNSVLFISFLQVVAGATAGTIEVTRLDSMESLVFTSDGVQWIGAGALFFPNDATGPPIELTIVRLT